jgi:hypothetical protein
MGSRTGLGATPPALRAPDCWSSSIYLESYFGFVCITVEREWDLDSEGLQTARWIFSWVILQKYQRTWPHNTTNLIASLVNTSDSYGSPGAARVLLSWEYTILSRRNEGNHTRLTTSSTKEKTFSLFIGPDPSQPMDGDLRTNQPTVALPLY